MQHKLAAQVRSLLPKSFDLLVIMSVRQEACKDFWARDLKLCNVLNSSSMFGVSVRCKGVKITTPSAPRHLKSFLSNEFLRKNNFDQLEFS